MSEIARTGNFQNSVDAWLFVEVLEDRIRLQDIPRDIRLVCDSLYTAAFRHSSWTSAARYIENLNTLSADIVSLDLKDTQRARLLRELADYMHRPLDDCNGGKEIEEYRRNFNGKLSEELSESERVRTGALLAELKAQGYIE